LAVFIAFKPEHFDATDFHTIFEAAVFTQAALRVDPACAGDAGGALQ
jgi:hypothetical protein